MEIRYASLYIEAGILYVRVRDGVRVTLEDAKESVSAGRTLIGGRERRLVLVDMRHMVSMSADARRFFASAATAETSSAIALLIESPVSRVIGNFMIGLNKAPYPTRLFTSETEAIQWLREQ